MGRTIRTNLRAIVAMALLAVVGLGTAYVVVQEQRLRIPVLEERPFELKAQFETAQAVVQGQGQTIRVAGVRVGDVSGVELEDGIAVVSFDIDREFLPVYRDATILMRPTTGLKDMFFELDPGTKEAGAFEEGETVPLQNTAPDVNLDQITQYLDSDTQAYLRLLLVGAGRGLEGRDKELGELLGGLGPINRHLARLNKVVASRDEELSELIHDLNLLTTRVGNAERTLTQFVSASDAALGVIAEQDPSVQRAVSLLPGTLQQAEETLNATADFAAVLGPTFDDLRPFARNLDELNASTEKLATAVTPTIENEIRPFVRSALPVMPNLRLAADRLNRSAPRLKTVFGKINRLGNMAAYNPNGAEPAGTPGRDEGRLYWVAWLANNGRNIYSAGDAHGTPRRIYLSMGCEHANALIDDPNPVLQQVRQLVTGVTDPVLNAVCSD